MSTRSLTGRSCADGFTDAVYVHSDGYPTYHGPALFALAEQFDGDLHRLLDVLTGPPIEGGWSMLTPGAPEDPYPDMLGERGSYMPNVGRYYTDGSPVYREEWHGGPLNTDTEWAYTIEPDASTLMVAKVVRADRDAPGYQPFDSTIQPVAVVRFGDAVDWAAIESGVSA